MEVEASTYLPLLNREAVNETASHSALVLGFNTFGISVLELLPEATDTLAGGAATSLKGAALRGLSHN
jgi:hypothetical protein